MLVLKARVTRTSVAPINNALCYAIKDITVVMESLSQQDLPLDDVKEFIYVALRSQERFSTALKALLESLDKKQDGQDEWLELVQEEMEKGVTFCNNQLNIWRDFSNRTNEYITFVRNEADIIAIEDLQTEKKVTTGSRVKTIHPELAKFKLEKQARILGKYGGVPAFGTGMMMQLPPRDKILQVGYLMGDLKP
ncbi:hypothetical protein CEUSTIGMA_g9034.t1 [Chlamydomonas eustigma]|uniref:Uncharacterized protein n=1 Tax=Chlamydomonas eustigma TaxID=1157962 RepID=A0A250XF04_9CHLO|nr:hypothetical protein CEUSTIGMA_g9034.t1 [Chlamydomonas eustigma]|eukprot:GAX81606.1 hypothetical protein CEUSTIGMA_g9034.t1 [Chlamydomonas eustigma]